MKKRALWSLALSTLLLVATTAARGEAEAGVKAQADGERLSVVVSIPPQAGIVERIGGPRVDLIVLVQPGQEPHTYEATPRQIMEIGRADLCFKIGMPFESRLVDKLGESGVGLRFVDMAASIPRRGFTAFEGHDHGADHDHGAGHDHGADHDHGAGHDHGADASAVSTADPHVWLAPSALATMAETTARALSEADPLHAAEYAVRLESFRDEIRAAEARIATLLAPLAGQRFYVFHPAFGYFADAFGLQQVAVEAQGREPTPRQLATLIAAARAEGVRVIFVQPQFSPQAAETVAKAIDGAVVPMDPLARDVLENLERMAREVHRALLAAGAEDAR